MGFKVEPQHFGSSKPVNPLASEIPANQLAPADSPIAWYRTGPPRWPEGLTFDNGFLQNPKDPEDLRPMPTVPPNAALIAGYQKQIIKVNVALEAARLGQRNALVRDAVPFAGLLDALEAYKHFLVGGGKARTFSYDKYVEEDSSGATTLNNAMVDIEKAAEHKYAEMLSSNPDLKARRVSFQLTGSPIHVSGSKSYFPYPKTENWQKALGAHYIWLSADVTFDPAPHAEGQFNAQMTLHAVDRYNFNPKGFDIATNRPDTLHGVFELAGLAKQYEQTATLNRTFSWARNESTDRKLGQSVSR